MSFGNFVYLFVAQICLTSCSDLHQNPTPLHYRAVDGEVFMMPCQNWSTVKNHKKEINEVPRKNFTQFKAETTHSGNYTCHTSAGWQFLYLQVVRKIIGCSNTENTLMLATGEGGYIPCPGHNCSNNTSIVWYKESRAITELRRPVSYPDGVLLLHTVDKSDSAVFFCDRELTEQGVNWTFRRSVTVKAINPKKYPPWIHYPKNNIAEEVELGMSHTLRCEVNFPEADPPGDVQWFVNYSGHLTNMTMEKLQIKELKLELPVIGEATIKEVTALHLKYTYTCIARNTMGNNSATISLKMKTKAQFRSLVEYSVGPLLLVAGLGIILHVKWLEIQLILKSRWTFSKPDVGHKDFDVLLSYVWSTPSMELVSSPQRHTDDAAFLFSLDPLKVEVPSEKLELLLPHVLEDQWGYRVCLMERDLLPGGAYTNDVANAIQRSQMLICLLSTEYLSDNNAVFVLESGVQALLQNSDIKLLLIWTNRAPVSHRHLNPPLPSVVQKALKVLPTLKWMSTTNTNFWRTLRKAMPYQKVLSLSNLQK